MERHLMLESNIQVDLTIAEIEGSKWSKRLISNGCSRFKKRREMVTCNDIQYETLNE